MQLQPEAVRTFLEASRADALAALSQAWLESSSFNELRLLPGLIFEGNWDNRPREVRQSLLEVLSQISQESWWSLNAFVSALHEKMPDFQRPGGDYESWFIRSQTHCVKKAVKKTGCMDFRAGMKSMAPWCAFLITGPLHWLGWFDLAAPAANSAPTAFRPSDWASALSGRTGSHRSFRKKQLKSGSLPMAASAFPVLASRTARYQISRFCEWESETAEEYRYKLVAVHPGKSRPAGSAAFPPVSAAAPLCSPSPTAQYRPGRRTLGKSWHPGQPGKCHFAAAGITRNAGRPSEKPRRALPGRSTQPDHRDRQTWR